MEFSFAGHAVEATEDVGDDLGLERVWKRCRTVLVSNAGKTVPDIGRPTGRWLGQAYRTMTIVLNSSP